MTDEEFDQTAFDAWVAGDSHRRSVFDKMWQRIMSSDMDAALSAYERRRGSRRNMLASGAAVLLVVVSGYQALPVIELRLAQPEEHAVAHGMVREVLLSDGTLLKLAGGANVKVRYTRHDRVVELAQGTIFANVVHDARRPFRVDTGNARIVDLGTSFEVLSKPANIRVTVATGVVQFGRKAWFSKPITLTANQAALLDATGLKRNADVDPGHVARWRNEWVEYSGAPLGQVIADLQALSPVPIEIADDSLAKRPVSGRIRLIDPAGQLQNLSITHEFQIRRADHALILSRN